MKKKIGIALGVVVAAILVVVGLASTRPNSMTVSRTAHVDAPPELVLPYVLDFELWSRWNPFDKLDPNVRKTFGSKRAGVGARYSWEGNRDVGAGSLEIVAIDRLPSGGHVVRERLVFVRPFASESAVAFSVEPEGTGSKVTWEMRSPQPLLSKVMGFFFDMDAMIGRQFEKGLATLGTLVH